MNSIACSRVSERLTIPLSPVSLFSSFHSSRTASSGPKESSSSAPAGISGTLLRPMNTPSR